MLQNCFSIKREINDINKLCIIKGNIRLRWSWNNGWTYHRRTETTHQFQLDIKFGQLKCLFMVVFGSAYMPYWSTIRLRSRQKDRQTNRRMCAVWTTRTDPGKICAAIDHFMCLCSMMRYVVWKELIKKNHSLSQWCCFSWCRCRLWACVCCVRRIRWTDC